ncbi:MAG: hypothetical protein ACREVK_03365 [Gammaproteobacteria bacterium]
MHRLQFQRLASNPEDLANMHVALQEWTADSAHIAELKKKAAQADYRSPISGVITDVADALHPGRFNVLRLIQSDTWSLLRNCLLITLG